MGIAAIHAGRGTCARMLHLEFERDQKFYMGGYEIFQVALN